MRVLTILLFTVILLHNAVSNETDEINGTESIFIESFDEEDYNTTAENETVNLLESGNATDFEEQSKNNTNSPSYDLDTVKADASMLPSFKVLHELKEDAELNLFQIDETSNSLTVNGKDYSLDDLVPMDLYSQGATISIDGKAPEPLTSLDATSALVASQGSDTIFVTKDSNGQIETIDVFGDDGSDTYMASVVSGIFAAVNDEDLDPAVLEDISQYQDVEDPREPQSRNLRKRATDIPIKEKQTDFADIINPGMDKGGRHLQLATSCDSFHVIEVAIAFDSTLCDRKGSFSKTKDFVEQVVARASVIYGKQGVCAKIKISHLEGFCTSSEDPYRDGIDSNKVCDDNDDDTLLDHFRDYWNANRGHINEDAAHLFYGKNLAGSSIGCAFITRLCLGSAKGVNDMRFSSNLNRLSALFAHELGHNTGMEHISDWFRRNVMQPSVGFGVHSWAEEAIDHLTTVLPEDNCISQLQVAVDKWSNSFGYSTAGWRVDKHPRFLADINGDGKDDIVGFGIAGVYSSLSTGTGFSGSSLKVRNFGYGSSAGGWRVDQHPRYLVDVNGDGMADIIGFGNAGVYLSLSTGSSFSSHSLVYRGFGKSAGGWRVDRHPRYLADVNGDGMADIVGFGNAGVYLSLSTGSGFGAASLVYRGFGYTAGGWRVDKHPRILADVNGDGMADIVGFGNAGVYLSLSTGSGYGTASLVYSGFGYSAGNWRVDKYPRYLADVNGDGMADIVGFGYSGVYVALSTGTGFSSASLVYSGFGYNAGNWRVDKHPRYLTDVNGDGMADIVGIGYSGTYVALSTGSGFEPAELKLGNFGYDSSSWRVDKHPRFLSDVNGDGKADVVGFGNDGVYVSTDDISS